MMEVMEAAPAKYEGGGHMVRDENGHLVRGPSPEELVRAHYAELAADVKEAATKKARATPPAMPAPAAWNPPPLANMYANGLACRAEAMDTSSGGWTVDGSQWRSANFSSADAEKAELKKRQNEARRTFLKK